MSRYDTYKPSGIDWIGEVPIDWKTLRIKNVASIINGSTPSSSVEEYWDGDIIWATPGDFNKFNKIIDDSESKITEAGYKSCGTSLVPVGSVVITTRAPIGNVLIAGKELCTNQGCKTLVPNRVESRFLYYIISISSIELNILGQGTTFLELSKESLGTFKLPLPEYNEQLTIANYLDDQTQKIDRLIANKKAQAEKLKELRQIEINNAVTKGLNPNAEMKDSGIEWLGKIPQHWEVKKVKQLLKPEKNAIKTGPFGSDLKFEDLVEQGVKVYNQRSVLDNDWVSGEGYITDEKYRSLETCTIYPGDIVITTRGTIGKASIFPDNAELGILHPCLMRVQMNNYRVLNDFLKIIINESGYFLEALKLASNATTIDVVYSDNLKEVKIAVPPTTEQKEIIAFVVKRTIAIDQLIKNIELQIEKLQELRKIKIYEAVTGKICLNQDFQDAQMNRIKTESL